MVKQLSAPQLKALATLADGKERKVYECGPTNTVTSLHARGLVEWRWSEKELFRLNLGYALVKINDAGRAALPPSPLQQAEAQLGEPKMVRREGDSGVEVVPIEEKTGRWEANGMWRQACDHYSCGYNVQRSTCPNCGIVSVRPVSPNNRQET